MMKSLLLAATGLGLVIAAGAASAGPCTTEIRDLQQQLSSTDAGMGPTGTGQVVETGNLHPPTEAMNQATEGKATSSEDVLSQNQGAPTDAEQSSASGSAAPSAADEALERARQYDQAGNEAACMDEIGKAKAQLGAD